MEDGELQYMNLFLNHLDKDKKRKWKIYEALMISKDII